ncbi:helix-turn-helix domain-containing protein [Prevotella sp. P6B1]|uniref:helix-turn-helix domain-containing protein n=1 Tax=Prevotella sp. P6B1 TaxID=1410613 RepID=UPI0009E0AAF1
MAETITAPIEDILSITEAAEVCKISTWGMYKRVERGEITAHHVGRRIYFLKSELFEYIRQL